MSGWLHLCAFVLYTAAAGLLGVSFARGDRRLTSAARAVLAVALAGHALGLAQFTAAWGELPLVGLGPSLSSLAFLVGLGSLIAATLGHAATLQLVLVPVVVVLAGAAAAVGLEPTGEAAAFRDPWGALHVFFAFVGLAGLAVASAAGLMYLLQFRELKSKHFGAIFRFFPPLETLDLLGRRGLLVGFPFLSLAVVLGWAWSARFEDAVDVAKLVWVFLTWAVFLTAIVARNGGAGSRRGALASVLGFVVVVVVYLVVRIQGIHGGSFL